MLVVGPAGTGKTTALGNAARLLGAQGRAAVGLAPSGKAADVLGAETDWPATTLAKLLYEHGRPDGPGPAWRLPAGTSVVLDEAGMASAQDLGALVALVERHRWRLVCVGDPAQLPAVGRGGMFALWCERLATHLLDEVHRFAEGWQAEASLALRRGDPAAAAAYAQRGQLATVHPALVADQVARQYERLASRGQSVAITTASAGTARAINVEIQRRRNPRDRGPSVVLADGTAAFAGDQVATRRNLSLATDTGAAVRNRQTWTVTKFGEDGSLVLTSDQRGSVVLPAAYVARHVDLAMGRHRIRDPGHDHRPRHRRSGGLQHSRRHLRGHDQRPFPQPGLDRGPHRPGRRRGGPGCCHCPARQLPQRPRGGRPARRGAARVGRERAA